jgi:hypothetical protein
MALSFGGLQSNMGPFKPVSLKGNANVHGVPMFVDKLPMTIGGIAGEDVKFGRVCSIDPDDRRRFVMGIPSGNVVKGISMLDPAIMTLDPGQVKDGVNYYFTGRPMTLTTLGVLDILEWDTAQSAPFEGATVWCRNDNGMLAFNDGTSIAASGYTKLNAFVYETLDPNGAKVFFNLPFVAPGAEETLTATGTPAATPAAGAVSSGTQVTLASSTPNAVIYYTIDGTTPTMASTQYTGAITITAGVTIKAIAIAEGFDVSSTLTAVYTIS